MKARNLKKLLENLPEVHEGRRGVSSELEELNRYMRVNDLVWADNSAITDHIMDAIGQRSMVSSYHAGSRNRSAYYGHGYVTGELELSAAREAAESLNLRCERGLIFSIPSPGIRDEYEFSAASHKWIFVRRWRKIRGAETLVTGKRQRIGRYSVQLARRGSETGYRVESFAGPLTATRTRTVSGAWFVRNAKSPVAAIDAALRPRYTTNRGKGLSPVPVTVTERLLRGICPPEFTVVITSASEGAVPSPAFREIATGEEYHFSATVKHRGLVREAREAFDRRAAQREQAEIAALVERGEADDIYVCAADSYRAGNCKAGTASFASRHNLDIHRHYRAAELAAQANGDGRFVKAAIIAGFRRHRREIERGYCLLSDHAAS